MLILNRSTFGQYRCQYTILTARFCMAAIFTIKAICYLGYSKQTVCKLQNQCRRAHLVAVWTQKHSNGRKYQPFLFYLWAYVACSSFFRCRTILHQALNFSASCAFLYDVFDIFTPIRRERRKFFSLRVTQGGSAVYFVVELLLYQP